MTVFSELLYFLSDFLSSISTYSVQSYFHVKLLGGFVCVCRIFQGIEVAVSPGRIYYFLS